MRVLILDSRLNGFLELERMMRNDLNEDPICDRRTLSGDIPNENCLEPTADLWENPSPGIRMTLVGSVFGIMGLLSGLILGIFTQSASDRDGILFLSSLIGIVMGCWLEYDQTSSGQDDSRW